MAQGTSCGGCCALPRSHSTSWAHKMFKHSWVVVVLPLCIPLCIVAPLHCSWWGCSPAWQFEVVRCSAAQPRSKMFHIPDYLPEGPLGEGWGWKVQVAGAGWGGEVFHSLAGVQSPWIAGLHFILHHQSPGASSRPPVDPTQQYRCCFCSSGCCCCCCCWDACCSDLFHPSPSSGELFKTLEGHSGAVSSATSLWMVIT